MSRENFIANSEAQLAEAEQRYAKRPTRKLEKELFWLRLFIAKARSETITADQFNTEIVLREKWDNQPEPDDSPCFW